MGKNSDDELEKRIKAILGDFDPTLPPPKIAAVPQGVKRPTWSVMIPTYNCAKYLTKTLESVLEQDPGPEHMQIEVVDDCSTLDDPEKVVREVGKGRVAFHRNPKNSGYCTLNFNVCIQRSIGHLVHILHGDDYVLPGCYDEIKRLNETQPEQSLLSTRNIYADESANWRFLSPLITNHANFSILKKEFHFGNQIQFAGIVVKRDFYEKFGGFLPSLVHSADWEMWSRAIRKGGGCLSPLVLASYRLFDGNDTGRLALSAENLKDMLRVTQIFRQDCDQFPYEEAIQHLISRATEQAKKFQAIGNEKSAKAAKEFSDALTLPHAHTPSGLAWFLYGCSNLLRRHADKIFLTK